MKGKLIFKWLSRIVAAGILLQTLRFKFAAHPDSILIFSSLGVEPWGRIVLGVIELLIAIAILVPKTSIKGSYGAMAIMIGAIISHIAVLGINFNNDGGTLFIMAIVVFVASALNVYLSRKNL